MNTPHNTPPHAPTAAGDIAANAQALAQQFLQSLQQDKSDLAALQQCLVDERKVLESNEHDKLPTYTDQKAKLTEKLDQRYAQRLHSLKAQNVPTNAEAWRSLIEQLQNTTKLPLVALWYDVEQQLRHCQQLLLINEKIVAALQNNVNQLMNALRGATGAGQTYSATGKAQVFSDNQTITSA